MRLEGNQLNSRKKKIFKKPHGRHKKAAVPNSYFIIDVLAYDKLFSFLIVLIQSLGQICLIGTYGNLS
jgi:hypothetical protein